MRHWLFQNAIALDQLLNTLLCAGWADETMSANAYRMEQEGKPWGFMRRVIDWLFSPIQTDHCRKAHEDERLRRQSPPSSRS